MNILFYLKSAIVPYEHAIVNVLTLENLNT